MMMFIMYPFPKFIIKLFLFLSLVSRYLHFHTLKLSEICYYVCSLYWLLLFRVVFSCVVFC
jgi:hypothetical protein